MARIRTIKPEFPHSESVGAISREARLCFIMLWTISDDHGKLRGASRLLASLLFPYDDDAPELMDSWLAELEAESCIVRYVVEVQQYIKITNWSDHQKVDRPTPSKIPDPNPIRGTVARAREGSVESREDSPPDLDLDLDQYQEGNGKGEEGKVLGDASATPPQDPSASDAGDPPPPPDWLVLKVRECWYSLPLPKGTEAWPDPADWVSRHCLKLTVMFAQFGDLADDRLRDYLDRMLAAMEVHPTKLTETPKTFMERWASNQRVFINEQLAKSPGDKPEVEYEVVQ